MLNYDTIKRELEQAEGEVKRLKEMLAKANNPHWPYENAEDKRGWEEYAEAFMGYR